VIDRGGQPVWAWLAGEQTSPSPCQAAAAAWRLLAYSRSRLPHAGAPAENWVKCSLSTNGHCPVSEITVGDALPHDHNGPYMLMTTAQISSSLAT
jgi:hypothetical protein